MLSYCVYPFLFVQQKPSSWFLWFGVAPVHAAAPVHAGIVIVIVFVSIVGLSVPPVFVGLVSALPVVNVVVFVPIVVVAVIVHAVVVPFVPAYCWCLSLFQINLLFGRF